MTNNVQKYTVFNSQIHIVIEHEYRSARKTIVFLAIKSFNVIPGAISVSQKNYKSKLKKCWSTVKKKIRNLGGMGGGRAGGGGGWW